MPILELIASGEVRLVVNTPTPRSGAVRDAAEIRQAATAEGILCLTAMETAVAAAEALDPAIAGRLADVRSLDQWVPAAVARHGARLRRCPRVGRRRRRRDQDGLAERPQGQRRQADHDDRQRELAAPEGRGADPGRRVRDRDDVAAPRAEHVAADDGGELDGPDQARAAARRRSAC